MAFLSKQKLREIGFKFIGRDVKISDKASFYNPSFISIDDNSRIDDFCVLSAGPGGILIGKNVHISTYVSLIGKGKIHIDDFTALSSRVSVYSSNDDYSGNYMTNPTVDPQFTNVTYGDVYIGKHVIIGSGSVILPDVNIEEGVAVGALSLVKSNCKSFHIYAGIPAKVIKKRKKRLLGLAKKYLKILDRSKNTDEE